MLVGVQRSTKSCLGCTQRQHHGFIITRDFRSRLDDLNCELVDVVSLLHDQPLAADLILNVAALVIQNDAAPIGGQVASRHDQHVRLVVLPRYFEIVSNQRILEHRPHRSRLATARMQHTSRSRLIGVCLTGSDRLTLQTRRTEAARRAAVQQDPLSSSSRAAGYR